MLIIDFIRNRESKSDNLDLWADAVVLQSIKNCGPGGLPTGKETLVISPEGIKRLEFLYNQLETNETEINRILSDYYNAMFKPEDEPELNADEDPSKALA